MHYQISSCNAKEEMSQSTRQQLLEFNVSKDFETSMYYLETRAVEVSAEKLFAVSNKAKKMRQKRYYNNSSEIIQNNLSSNNTNFYNYINLNFYYNYSH